MNVELGVINLESPAIDDEFCVEYVDLMLTLRVDRVGLLWMCMPCACHLRSTCVPPAWDCCGFACHVRRINVTIYVYMAYDTEVTC